MKPVFLDTSYFVALLSKGDTWHAVAVDWSQQILGRQVVTEYVLVELGGTLSKTRDRKTYVPFVQHLLGDPSTLFIPASGDLFQRGLALFAARPDKDWSLVDCISFVVMKQHRLTNALTADDHFKQAGFNGLLI